MSKETNQESPAEQTESKWDTLSPSFPEDPKYFTEQELLDDPSKRYRVNPELFPIFSQQAEMGPNWGDKMEKQPLDETMGRFVKCTADTIAVLTGEGEKSKIPAADYIIYLDKSARPVSWLVNTFWSDFTEKERPKHSYLAIDRMEWFKRTDTKVDSAGYAKRPDGTSTLATIRDIKKENITDEQLARIRALFIPGGIETEDPEEIMNTPTNLEGKNITIIDEVERSGTTLEIAKYLVSMAIPEAASVNGSYFWDGGFQTKPGDSSEKQMRSVPVWYDPSSWLGRGIGDINEDFYEKRYEKYPNPKTRAQKFGAFVLGEYKNLSEEPGQKSRELAKEIKLMHQEWENGHILMPAPSEYDTDKWIEHCKEQGIRFMRNDGKLPNNAYLKVREKLSSRPPVE